MKLGCSSFLVRVVEKMLLRRFVLFEPPSSNSNFWLGEPFRPSIRYTTVPECAYCLRLELREHLPDTSSLATDATTSTTDFALLMIFTMSQCNGHSLQAGYISWDRDPFQPLPAVFKLYSTAPLMRHFLRPLYVLPTSITHEPFNGPDLWLARSHARKDWAMCLIQSHSHSESFRTLFVHCTTAKCNFVVYPFFKVHIT